MVYTGHRTACVLCPALPCWGDDHFTDGSREADRLSCCHLQWVREVAWSPAAGSRIWALIPAQKPPVRLLVLPGLCQGQNGPQEGSLHDRGRVDCWSGLEAREATRERGHLCLPLRLGPGLSMWCRWRQGLGGSWKIGGLPHACLGITGAPQVEARSCPASSGSLWPALPNCSRPALCSPPSCCGHPSPRRS